MLKEFRDFIMRGNVIDLAVAVVIGGAFAALIGVFTEALINPLVNSFFEIIGLSQEGGNDWTIEVPGGVINLSAMITALIAFVGTALVLFFVFVKPINAAKARFAKPEEESASAEDLLAEIRDLLAEQSEGR